MNVYEGNDLRDAVRFYEVKSDADAPETSEKPADAEESAPEAESSETTKPAESEETPETP